MLSLPVFITPRHADHGLHCRLGEATAAGVMAHCRNEGNAHARIGQIEWRDGSRLLARNEGSHYLLPGSRRDIELAMDSTERAALDGLRVRDRASEEHHRLEALIDGPKRVSWPIADVPADERLR